MLINSTAIYRHVGEFYRGNLTAFARAIGVDRVVVWRALNNRSNGTQKFFPALYYYCKRENLPFDEFLIHENIQGA